jgi:FMN phosphatase YigB (HAD superfamily)
MVGDDWENDVLGATAAGLSALFLNRAGAPKSGEINSLREIYLTR